MSRTLQELRDQAVVNVEPFYESIVQRGTAAITFQTSGTPCYRRQVNTIGLTQQAVNDCIASSALVASPVDLTGTFTVEIAFLQFVEGSDYSWYHIDGATSGMVIDRQATNTFWLYLYNAAAIARSINLTAPSIYLTDLVHVIIQSTTGGTAGAGWVDNIPATVALVGAGAAVNPAASTLRLCGYNAGLGTWFSVRAWAGALDADERRLLYEAHRAFVRPIG